jgi:uncharacterized damage-inducible protein DinB
MNPTNFPGYFKTYIEKVPEGALLESLQFSLNECMKSLVMIDDSKGNRAYAEGKWTIKELLQHMIDTERIFCFRALAFARGEKAEITGFDQDLYVKESNANQRSMKSILEEYKRLRASTIDLFQSFSDEAIKRKGVASNNELSVEQIGYVIIGHEMHHVSIIEERYL